MEKLQKKSNLKYQLLCKKTKFLGTIETPVQNNSEIYGGHKPEFQVVSATQKVQ